MPRLMEKKDWMQTMADVGSADEVWFENVAGDACTVSLSLPEAGRVRALGDVNAERFIMLMNREPFDYTEWRKDNLFVDETVDSLMDKAEVIYGDLYAKESDDVHQ